MFKGFKMGKRKLCAATTLWMLFVVLQRHAEAGLVIRLSRMAREVYPEMDSENEGNQAQVCIVGDVVYGTDEPIPADQPCLKCRCTPPGVQCETIQCVKKPGCKAIHKSNECCPDYQCECQHNGKFYANGEKLETLPGGECKVCYCRGGEVQCAEVSCYIRKDCEGRSVPGTCCLKYDHCPPIDRAPYSTEITLLNSNKENFQTWLVTGIPPNITQSIFSPSSNDIQDENKVPEVNYFEASTSGYKAIEIEDLLKESSARITIQEIIPERKEIPVTALPKFDNEPQGTLVIEEAEKFLNNFNDLVTDSDADSSDISETFQQPPPVLRIGDKLLFLKKGEFVSEKDTSTPNSVITIIGAEGLQRGYEESGEVHEVKLTNIRNETDNLTEFREIENANFGTNRTSLESENNRNINVLELNTNGPSHILSLVERKNKPQSTTEAPTAASSTTDNIVSPENKFIPIIPSEIPLTNFTEISNIEETTSYTTDSSTTRHKIGATDSLVEIISTFSPILSITKTYEIISEQNPAYPPIPEIMSPIMDDASQRFDVHNIEKDNENFTPHTNMKILPDVLEIRSNKTVPQNITHSEWLKNNHNTLINYEASLPDELLTQVAPSDYDETTEIISIALSTSPSEVSTTNAGIFETVTTELGTAGKTDNILAIESSNLEETSRSMETMEDLSDDSGELTLKQSRSASISDENASVESNNKATSEANDMISTEAVQDDTSVEKTTNSSGIKIDNVKKPINKSTDVKVDVEFIDTLPLEKQKHSSKRTVSEIKTGTTTTAEILPQPEKFLRLIPKTVRKRENYPDDETIEVFKELDQELNAETTVRSLTREEEGKEAESIFRELLEDTSTLKVKKNSAKPHNRETEVLQKVNDALAQFSLRGKQTDSSILSIFTNIFNSQYKHYEK